MMSRLFTWFAVCGLSLLSAVSFSTAVLAKDVAIDFRKQIQPIFASKCIQCHGPDAEKREGGLRLDEMKGALAETDSGERAIVPGKPHESVILERVASDDEDMLMPPRKAGKKLTSKEVNLLKRWISQGAKFKRHWSFENPRKPVVPATLSHSKWARNDLDRLVLKRLDVEKLKPSPEADRRTLIRRVSLALTGLPPTVEEVNQFVKDDSADAYEKVVDRLLGSDAYGERWARVWLDLARYADSQGYAQDSARTIWRYRDWVIRSINENKPFDQFTIEQLAGDLLEKPTDDQLIATAFHRNTMTNSEGGTDNEEFRNAAVVDRVNTTINVWMGLTMGCAQCHTHKYDPITHKEYFQIFAIFNNTADADQNDERPNLYRFLPAQIKQRESLKLRHEQLQKELAKKIRTNKLKLPIFQGELQTRFVRVQLLTEGGTKGFLSLAEVELFSSVKEKKTGKVVQTNVAKKGVARQSSDYRRSPAKRAIDGNKNGDFSKKSVTHTEEERNPWWEVDLKSSQHLNRVVLWNRTDGKTGKRLKRYRVVGMNADRVPIWGFDSNVVPSPNREFKIPSAAADLRDESWVVLNEYHRLHNHSFQKEQRSIDSALRQYLSIKKVPTPIFQELEKEKRRKTFIQIRGNFMALGKEVQPAVLEAFHPLSQSLSGQKMDRLSFARWLMDAENPLTARVTVNRYWEQLYGRGLVHTSEDFGMQGERPEQQELLDFLAVRLVEEKWDIKKLLRMIVTSSTYRQSSKVSAALQKRDRDNVLFARGPHFRLPAEMIRDNSLAVSGLLSRKMYGASVRPLRPSLGLRAAFGGSTDWKTSTGGDQYRRGLYTSWRRTTPYPSMATFDAPSREVCTIRRIRTNTPLQALVTLNDPSYVEAAQAFARRMMKEGGKSAEAKIEFGFQLCLSRKPSEKELKRVVLLHQQAKQHFATRKKEATELATHPLGAIPKGMDVIELAAWTTVANVLFNLDETLTIH